MNFSSGFCFFSGFQGFLGFSSALSFKFCEIFGDGFVGELKFGAEEKRGKLCEL